MRKIQGKEIRTRRHPTRKHWHQFDMDDEEGGSGNIRDDVLGQSTRHGRNFGVPDLSHIKGTRQHREAEKAKRKGKTK